MALIELKNVHKTYRLGEVSLPVLRDVSLTIEAGEFVALMGSSGSGKTTLMNLLGCLDRPTSGEYLFDGLRVTHLNSRQLSALRSGRIGFVFQSFNLLPRTSALDNVRMPTAYSARGLSLRRERQRSRELLQTVGLEGRVDHSPAQLSGGEQQRVAIARSLVNEPRLLLADEPTGNLDSRTGKEILQLFRRLNEENGITLLLVTHDAEVARHADRVIRIADGRIVDEPGGRGVAVAGLSPAASAAGSAPPMPRLRSGRSNLRVATGAARIALQALRRNVMRTVLTMLGVIIGVAAVIAMMEISNGASAAIQTTVVNMGANTLYVGSDVARRGSQRIASSAESLTPEDGAAIADECSTINCTAPMVTAHAQVVFGNRSWTPIYLTGSTADFLVARNWEELERGRIFTDREVRAGGKVCLIGKTLVQELFGDRDPIGEEIRVSNVPFLVIGVLSEKGSNLLGTDQDDILLAPWTTIKYRVSGGDGGISLARSAGGGLHGLPGLSLADRLPGMALRVRDASIPGVLVKVESPGAIPLAIEEISRVLRDRHGLGKDESDFRIYDNAEVSNALKKTIRMLSGLGMSVAAVSLIVGGVGIMNIMLVSVTERTREIGLRMAVGAGARDILRQFLVEAMVLCLVGGLIGIVVGRCAALAVGGVMGWRAEASIGAAVLAVAVSLIVGVTFGYYPAWKASRLNPIDALRYE